MTTLHLTTEETRYLKARMRLTAMNETGATAATAERILDLLCIADTSPRQPARSVREIADRFDEWSHAFIGGTA